MKRTILALALACCGLAGCDAFESVDPMVAQVGQTVLGRVVPPEFESLTIRESFPGDEKCTATVTRPHWQEWGTSDGALEASGPRRAFDITTLSAKKNDKGHWVISDSDADPKSLAASEFEKRVTECINSLHAARDTSLKYEKLQTEEVAHNLQSWNQTTVTH